MGDQTGAAAGGMISMLISLAILIFYIVCYWKIFTKAGKPGWAILIPIYNVIVFLQIAGKPGWWVILMFIPLVNIIFGIIALVGFCENFGKGVGFVLGLIFLAPIFIPILAFGDARYQPAQPAAG